MLSDGESSAQGRFRAIGRPNRCAADDERRAEKTMSLDNTQTGHAFQGPEGREILCRLPTSIIYNAKHQFFEPRYASLNTMLTPHNFESGLPHLLPQPFIFSQPQNGQTNSR